MYLLAIPVCVIVQYDFAEDRQRRCITQIAPTFWSNFTEDLVCYTLLRVGVKPGPWTMDWTMDWAMDWAMDWTMD